MTKMEKERRELERLEKAETFHSHKHYFLILIIVLSIVYIVDELASSVRGIVEVQTIRDLFNVVYPSSDYDKASATLGFVTMAGYLSYLISPFYKSLADKWGRKPFLIINTLGMGVGMLVCIISKSVALYIVGTVILTFFTPNDVQVIYIMECAPKEHRAKLCSLTKGLALISVSLLGLFVKLFVNDEVPATWRNVFIIPIILAFVIGFAAIYFVRETPVFTQKRLSYLRGTEEEKLAAIEEERVSEEKEKEKSASVWDAIKYIFSNPQTRAIALVALLMMFSTGYTGKYQPMLEAGKYNGVMTTDAINIILMFYLYDHRRFHYGCFRQKEIRFDLRSLGGHWFRHLRLWLYPSFESVGHRSGVWYFDRRLMVDLRYDLLCHHLRINTDGTARFRCRYDAADRHVRCRLQYGL